MIVGGAAMIFLLIGPTTTEPAEPWLREASTEWGIVFRHHDGGAGDYHLPETMGSGVAIFDYDDDGDGDVLFLDGRALDGYTGETPRSRLFRNDLSLGGTFVDVTERSRLQIPGYATGIAIGDLDGDGVQDLVVTCVEDDRIYLGQRDGTFEDVTAKAGLGEARWSASAALADADGDGRLDLYVTGYVGTTYEAPRRCQIGELDERPGYCDPALFDGVADRFYRGRGDGTFIDRTEAAGLVVDTPGRGLGVVFTDLDGDGAPDLYVANDTDPNHFFRGQGDGTFEDRSLLSGTSHGDRGRPEAGMGVATGDFDGDRQLDLAVTNFDLETTAIYRGLGGGLFLDARHLSRAAEPSIGKLGFGVAFVDLDGDGSQDLVVANGHVSDHVGEMGHGIHYPQTNQLLQNRSGRFKALEAGFSGLTTERVSRGLAKGDLDLDGDPDLVFTNVDDVAEVYENRSGSSEQRLGVLLRGGPGGRGIGALIHLETDGRSQMQPVLAGDSYLSQSETRLLFGLGGARRVELEILWPNGLRQALRGVPPIANRMLVVGAPGDRAQTWNASSP